MSALECTSCTMPPVNTWVLQLPKDRIAQKEEMNMTKELIKEVKHIQQCLIDKEMTGEEWEEKMEIVRKLEDVSSYLKDALGRGIEF